MAYWKTEHFKALQKLWYLRLEAEGFDDAEAPVAGDMELKQSALGFCRYGDRSETTLNNKEDYYIRISHHVTAGAFDSDTDRLILLWHSEGYQYQIICEALKAYGISRCRHSIRFIVRKYELRWGLTKWTPKQLNLRRA